MIGYYTPAVIGSYTPPVICSYTPVVTATLMSCNGSLSLSIVTYIVPSRHWKITNFVVWPCKTGSDQCNISYKIISCLSEMNCFLFYPNNKSVNLKTMTETTNTSQETPQTVKEKYILYS